VTMCTHQKPKWVVFDSSGGNVALDDNEDVTHYSMVEWCSECGSVKIGDHWIAPGNGEPPWLTVNKTLSGVTLDIEHWTKDSRHGLSHEQVDQLCLALDHVHRARGFLDRAFGVQTITERPEPLSEPPPPAE
jgi:hypothetical protein